LASRGKKSLPIAEHRKKMKDVKKGDKSSKPMIKESMAIAVEPVRIFAKEKKEERMKGPSQEGETPVNAERDGREDIPISRL
jgi:hypothetical protein